MGARHVLGVNESQAINQFKINPRLQRTRVEIIRQGLTLGTEKPEYPVIQNNSIRLPNRAMPRNSNFQQKKRVPRFDAPSLMNVPNPPALTKEAK